MENANLKISTYRTANNEIWLDDSGILWLKPDAESELSLEEAKDCFGIYKKMGIGGDRKVLQIIDARLSVSMCKEAREYAMDQGKYYFVASAVISSSLSVRLIVNFFNRFHKADVPLKLFQTEGEAKRWLSRFKA